jgi:hypothetical protein
MNTKIFASILLLINFMACKTSEETKQKDATGILWVDTFNEKSKHIESVYTENALLLLENGNVIKGRKGIESFYEKFRNENEIISEYSVFADKTVNATVKVKYEIGGFASSSGNTFKHLAISEEHDNEQLRLFEIIALSEMETLDLTCLEQRRVDWINAANSHNATEFISDLYTENAVYYYHGGNALYIGNSNIVDAYRFMEAPSYRIDKLEAIHVEPVSSNLVFEIGTWIMPGAEGEYVIVWQLCTDKVWRILFDSNY